MSYDSLQNSSPAEIRTTSGYSAMANFVPSTENPHKDGPMWAKWNDTRAEFPELCVHELFEEQVTRDPDAVAVVCKGRSLTYRQLNSNANKLANYLRGLGVGPESLVGVCLERKPELVIALLAVWKAGGAYVPLDPSYPKERLEFMVGDASVRALLTDEAHKNLFESSSAQIISLDTDWQKIFLQNDQNLAVDTTPANLAYVMYTSGSTGKPKGAMIHHRGLMNYLWWAIGEYKVRAGGSVPVHSSISFDLTVTSLYPALLVGGKVDLLAEDVGAVNLLAALRETKSRNLVKITPAHLEAISHELSKTEMNGLTDVFVIGGEALLSEHLRVWREASPQTRLINEYGPTETVVGCCVYEVQPEDPHNGPVPIGRPIANMRMYVLDENLRLLPPGETGELYIGGVGVARGYWNRKELTEERFLLDPFSDDLNARMYKTGDLGRYRSDGVLEYQGRIDNQVKVRGYRIELGEIEAALTSWPPAKSCAVLAREDAPGDKQLVGYLVLKEDHKPDTEELRAFLERLLPEYMVPSRFVFLDAFPLTPNGKIDRKALPAASEQQKKTSKFVPAADDVEEMLVGIWEKLLKIKPIGVTDDFFDLGGHSLLALKVSVEVEKQCQVKLPLASLFTTSTIRELAATLRESMGSKTTTTWTSFVVMQPQGTKPPLFLVHGAGGNLLLYRALAKRLAPDYPLYGFQSLGLDGESQPLRTIEEMAAHYVRELRAFQPHGPYHLGGYCMGGTIAYEMARILTSEGEKVPLVAMLDTYNFSRALKINLSSFILEKTKFHMANIAQLNPVHMFNYLREKMHHAFDGEIANLKGAVQLGPDDGEKMLEEAEGTVHTINDYAVHHFDPKPYGGKVALFKPRINYKFYPDPQLGWGDLVQGQLEVIEASAYPHAMLLEPYVEILAEQLKEQISGATSIGEASTEFALA